VTGAWFPEFLACPDCGLSLEADASPLLSAGERLKRTEKLRA
jgi:hypothetical protein